MDLSEQISLVASSLANSPAEDVSATYRSNLQFLVATAVSLGQDLALIDLTESIQMVASNLAASFDEDMSRTYRANLKFLVELTETLAKASPVTKHQSPATTFVDPGDELLTTTQAASALDLSRATLMKLIEAGDIEHVMVGSHHRIPVQSIRAYKRSRLVSRERAHGAESDSSSEETPTGYHRTVQFGDDGALR